MFTISNAVSQILSEDAFTLTALQRGILNISAYAKEIQPTVEEKTFKTVKLGTIVVALTRAAQTLQKVDFLPTVVIDSLHVTSSLSEITYEKTDANLNKLILLNKVFFASRDFFTVTEGLHEITLICSSHIKDEIVEHFASQTKKMIDGLVAVSVHFSEDYIAIPNTIYALLHTLASRQINILEIVSTYTELTFIVDKSAMQQTVQVLDAYSQEK